MKRKAFSLLELLIVISTVIVLVKVAIPRFKGLRDQGMKSQAQTQLYILKNAVISYYLNQSPQAIPPTTSTLQASYLTQATPQIINNIMYDPFNWTTQGSSPPVNMEYGYVMNNVNYKSTSNAAFVIFSNGPNVTAGNILISSSSGVSGLDIDDICVSNRRGC